MGERVAWAGGNRFHGFLNHTSYYEPMKIDVAKSASPIASSQVPSVQPVLASETYMESAQEWKAPTLQEMVCVAGGQSVSWSDFAGGRHQPGSGYSYFQGSPDELLGLVKDSWDARKPGTGRTNLDEVVTVPLPAEKFMATTIAVTPETELKSEFYRRREHEAPYIRTTAKGQAQPAQFAQAILYSKDTLGANKERSTSADWEVVSLVAGPVENEPMDPVTMLRNVRGLAGGSQVDYSTSQLLDSIEFWSKHTKVQS